MLVNHCMGTDPVGLPPGFTSQMTLLGPSYSFRGYRRIPVSFSDSFVHSETPNLDSGELVPVLGGSGRSLFMRRTVVSLFTLSSKETPSPLSEDFRTK